uniref:Uncharacterized protein n=1 Tax=Pyrodinium bahamense TaxID=73915 RepID=A0A7S0FDI9_9DINO|mmetsp:Transcript_23006/g.63881  ORF Transcript_23006/g.63881 Transcript_23006/m.63881 type:complete len:721 (+) Transcript_23006:79-2241(+)
MAALLAFVVLAAPVCTAAERQLAAANPIRKVVTMLQDMKAKVTEEGEREQALYEKFMCYCKNSGGTLEQSIDDGKAKIASLTSALEESGQKKGQTAADLKEHQASRSEAEDAMAKATALREKQAAAFAAEKADSDANTAALTKAIPLIEKGMAGAFLQTGEASALRRFAMEKATLPDQSRQDLLAFLSGTEGSGYVPQSGEIVGILKQLLEEMDKSMAEALAAETESISTYEALMAAKKKEVETLTAQIEEEQRRIGELGVALASMENDLTDTQESLAADSKFKAELETSCSTKTEEWDEVKRTRAEELKALAETIKVLNDDDALEVFKKTLPSASASFMQYPTNAASQRAKALAMLRAVRHNATPRPELDFIAVALSGKKIGFDKVISMIDEMAANLKKEQESDDAKKEYCESEFDSSDDKKKGLERALSDSETAIEEMEGSIAKLKEEIAALEAGIKALDKSVAEATENRKAENKEYSELMTSDNMAKDLLLWAKNRLNKFYNPKLYKAPPKRELTGEERITESFGGEVPTAAPGGIAGTGIGAALVQVSAHDHGAGAPPPPPETFGPYTKKTQESAGVMAMIDLLIKDLDKEMQEADVSEKDAQKEYEVMMAESATKRADDAKSVADKTSAKAAEEEALEAEQDAKAGTGKEHMATMKYIAALHGECDWLLQNYAARKEARTGEIDALGKAKAVLNGADYLLVQTSRTGRAAHGFLY